MKKKSLLNFTLAIFLFAGSVFANENPKSNLVYEKGKLDKNQANNNWTVIKEKDSKYPIRAFGTPTQISGFESISNINIQSAAEAFISQKQQELNIIPENLKFCSSRTFNNLYYVTFRQYYNGIEVLKSEVELRITKKGKVIAYGIKYYDNINMDVMPKLSSSAAIAKALDQISIQKKTDALQSSEKLFILPKKTNGIIKYNLVYNVIVNNSTTFSSISNYIDANNADIIEKINLVNDANTKITVSGTVNPLNPTQEEAKPLPYLNLTIAGKGYQTDANGELTADISEQSALSGKLNGKYGEVICKNVIASTFTSTVQPSVDYNLNIDANTRLSERNAYYYLNSARNNLLSIDPEIISSISDNFITVTLTYDQSEINASSSGDKITFVGLSFANNKMIYMPDVFLHEYGHSINKFLYNYFGYTDYGMINSACNEALADVNAAGYIDEHELCKNYDSDEDNSLVRDIKNTNTYPDSTIGESHRDGLVLSGAYWDLKEMTSLDYFRKITHFTKYGLPDDEDLGIAFSKWFVETLIADDNMDGGDQDLTNGTPHFDQIVTAFDNHKIGFGLYMNNAFNHTAINDKDNKQTNLDFDYNFNIDLYNLITIDSTFLVYSTDFFQTTKRMLSSLNGTNAYKLTIDYLPMGTVVFYYFETYFNGSQVPTVNYLNNNSKTPYQFLVGYKNQLTEQFNTSTGWKFGENGDNATIGKWEIASSQYSPIIEYYFSGFMPMEDCSINGNSFLVTDAEFDYNYFSYHVNSHFTNGKTTVTSPTYNTSNYYNPLVSFYQWFSFNNYYNVKDIALLVDFSYDDGNTWENVNSTSVPNNAWERQVFPILATNYFKIRFTLSAPKAETLNYYLKAFIDDLSLWSQGELSVDESGIANNNIKIYPSPANNIINIQTNGFDNIEIISSIGEIVNKIDSPGTEYKWDRCDLSGSKVPAGIYFCRIKQNNNYIVEKFIIVD